MATQCCSFELIATNDLARRGQLTLTHGTVQTPAFMPVGTRGTVRGLASGELRDLGAEMVLANTYHLWVRPGHRVIEALGGLHAFMGWNGPLLTDSGGYQVFSMRDRLKVTEQGAKFRSPEDGEYRMLTPELAVEIQEALGVDVMMAFDECLEWPADRDRSARSTQRTTRWLKRCEEARKRRETTALFGIVQGGLYEDLRAAHAEEIGQLDLDGYAVGGLSVGEPKEDLLHYAEWTAKHLPSNKVRYLMGVGHPVDLVDAVLRGIDLFDCVIPSRAGRHGQAYTSVGRLNLKTKRFELDSEPLDPNCSCFACATVSRAYLRHLVRSKELLGKRLLTVHNLHFYQDLMRTIREAISSGQPGRLQEVRAAAFIATYPPTDAGTSQGG